MKGEREGFRAMPGRVRAITSGIINPQFTGLNLDIAPYRVLAMVRLIRLGLSRFKMGNKNSSTLLSLLFLQFPRWNPTFGSASPLYFPVNNPSRRLAHPSEMPLGNP